jgi:DNA-directed RNA polymerase specialized sigma24 family protein
VDDFDEYVASRWPRLVRAATLMGCTVTEAVDRTDAVARSLAALTDDQRTAVVLRYYLDLTERQMATVLGVAPGTVKSRLSRALGRLADDPHLLDLRGPR